MSGTGFIAGKVATLEIRHILRVANWATFKKSNLHIGGKNPLITAMKSSVILFYVLLLLAPLAQAQVQITNTPVDINNRLQEALDRLAEESRKEQKLTGGTMAVAGGALATAALFGTLVGNDFSTQTAPVLYLTASGLLTVGGIMNLTRENLLSEKLKELRSHPQITLNDIQEQISAGQDLLRSEAERSRQGRIWGGLITVLAGASNIAIGELTTPPSRLGFEISGYTTASLGLADYMIESRRWTGSALIAMGMGNAITDRIDPYSPSSDYLLISGAITAAAGLARLIISYPAELEQRDLFNSIKNETKSDFFVIPTREGMLAATRLSF
jgi:hypothetical protein